MRAFKYTTRNNATLIFTNCDSFPAENNTPQNRQIHLQDKYKIYNPKPISGIDSLFISDMVDVLGSTALHSKTKDSCVTHIWNAFTNPIHFDSTFKDFSTKCLRLLANGELDKEEKPFLAEWSYFKTDLEYLRFVLNRVLTFYNCKSYGDDTDGIGAALYQIKQTRNIPLPKYRDDENAVQYLRRLNKTVLLKHHKVTLIEKDFLSIYVCDKSNLLRLRNLASKVKLELIEP